MSLVSQDNQDLLWDLIAETGILHTVANRIPNVQKHFQNLLLKYQHNQYYTSVTDKNKIILQEMIQYIKSFHTKVDTAESLRLEREHSLQQSVSAIEDDFNQYAQQKKMPDIDFSDPVPDPNSYTPIQQVLHSQQEDREKYNKIDVLLKETREVKQLVNEMMTLLKEKV